MLRNFLLKASSWLFLTLVVLIPFSTGYLWRDPLAISYLNIFSVIFIFLSLVNLAFGTIKPTPVTSKSLLIIIGSMFLMLAWGTLFSDPLRTVLGPWTSRFLQPLFVGYFGWLLFRSQQLNLAKLASALWVSLLLIGLQGLAQYFGWLENNNSRLTGSYLFPGSYARIIEYLLLLLLPNLLLIKNRWQVGRHLVWLLGFFILLGTESYAGIGSFLLAALIIILFLPKNFRTLKIGAVVCLIIGTIIVGVYRESLPKYQATFTSSLATRQQFWHIAGQTIKAHPLTGIGLEGWEQNYLQLARTHIDESEEKIIETVSAQPHNIFLDALLRAGVIGLLAISFLLFWPIAQGIKLIKNGQTNWLAFGAIGYGAAMIFFGLVDDPIFSDDTMALLFIACFALILIPTETPKLST